MLKTSLRYLTMVIMDVVSAVIPHKQELYIFTKYTFLVLLWISMSCLHKLLLKSNQLFSWHHQHHQLQYPFAKCLHRYVFSVSLGCFFRIFLTSLAMKRFILTLHTISKGSCDCVKYSNCEYHMGWQWRIYHTFSLHRWLTKPFNLSYGNLISLIEMKSITICPPPPPTLLKVITSH